MYIKKGFFKIQFLRGKRGKERVKLKVGNRKKIV
jgi:hypothetical protein